MFFFPDRPVLLSGAIWLTRRAALTKAQISACAVQHHCADWFWGRRDWTYRRFPADWPVELAWRIVQLRPPQQAAAQLYRQTRIIGETAAPHSRLSILLMHINDQCFGGHWALRYDQPRGGATAVGAAGNCTGLQALTSLMLSRDGYMAWGSIAVKPAPYGSQRHPPPLTTWNHASYGRRPGRARLPEWHGM